MPFLTFFSHEKKEYYFDNIKPKKVILKTTGIKEGKN